MPNTNTVPMVREKCSKHKLVVQTDKTRGPQPGKRYCFISFITSFIFLLSLLILLFFFIYRLFTTVVYSLKSIIKFWDSSKEQIIRPQTHINITTQIQIQIQIQRERGRHTLSIHPSLLQKEHIPYINCQLLDLLGSQFPEQQSPQILDDAEQEQSMQLYTLPETENIYKRFLDYKHALSPTILHLKFIMMEHSLHRTHY